MGGARRQNPPLAEGGGGALSERLCWLRAARVDLLGQVQAEEERLRQFQETADIQEASLLKRVRLTYQAERRRAGELHEDLAGRLRQLLGAVEQQLSRLEALATTLVASHSSPSPEEAQRLPTEELPPLPELPPPGAVREAWERTCPAPRWKLSCDWMGASQDREDWMGASQDQEIASHQVPRVDSSSRGPGRPAIASQQGPGVTSRVSQWPAPERAAFKGGTSLPLPMSDAESSGPEDSITRCRSEGFPQPLSPDTFTSDCDYEAQDVPEDVTFVARNLTNGSQHRKERRRSTRQVTHRNSVQCGEAWEAKSSSRELSGNWVKSWLDSSELNDLIETTAEIEAIKKLERDRAAARARRRLGL